MPNGIAYNLQESLPSNFNQAESILRNEHNNWKGSNFQVDDILVMGVKF